MSMKAILFPLAAIIVGMFMVILDTTAMNVMLRQLMLDFSASYNTVQWTVTGYSLAQAAVIPLSGWLSDRFGAKRVFLTSIALFSLGSLFCSFATGIEPLVIFRILQGLGGGMVVPIGFAFTYRLSPPEKVGTVMGFMSIPILMAPALGPVLSGWFVDYVSWHWIFLINVPIGIVGVLIGARSLPRLERQTVAALDWMGMVLGPLGFASLSYGVTEGSTGWVSWNAIGGMAVGGVALLAFVVTQLRHSNPLLELRAFQSVSFTRGIIVLWIAQFSFFGTIFLIPQYLQNVRGYSAFDAGLCMLPYALASAIMMQVSGRLFDRFGARWLAITGILLLAVAGFLFSRIPPGARLVEVVIPVVLLGTSMGLCMMPLNTHVLKSAPQHVVGRITSLTGAMQQVMTSFSVASLATILTTKIKDYTSAGLSPNPAVWSHAFRDTFIVVMIIALAGVLMSFLIRRLHHNVTRPTATTMMVE